jgi:hypothetical protein
MVHALTGYDTQKPRSDFGEVYIDLGRGAFASGQKPISH